MENVTTTICGIAKQNDEMKNIIKNELDFNNADIKELIYSTEYGDVEALIGFEDLEVLDLDIQTDIVRSARLSMCSDESIQGIVFIKGGFLVITDLVFFSAYTYINGVSNPYISMVESHTYEEDEATEMIYNDVRLS